MSTHSGSFAPDPSWPTILELATKLWGEPTDWSHDRNEARFGAKGSKSVKLREMVWKDHEADTGGGYVDLHKLAIGPLPKTGNGKLNGELPPWDDIKDPYPYHNADGELILEVVRTISGSPRFRQRKPLGGDRWKWKVTDIPGHDCLLYRLPELRAASIDAIVWICEGEKDADRLRKAGLIATTNIGGAGKWRVEYAEEFRGKHCVVLVDNDPQTIENGKPLFHPDGRPVLPGQDHAAAVARSLVGVAASVKLLLLPGLPLKGDVSDWLDDDAGNTVEELQRLAHEAPEWTAPEKTSPDPEKAARVRHYLSVETWAARPMPEPDRLLGDVVTTTTRLFLVGRTGLGKTQLGYAIGNGIASGKGFLHWQSSRAARVLVIDGEMPAELIKARSIDLLRRGGKEPPPPDNLLIFSRDLEEQFAAEFPSLGTMPPLNTEEGHNYIIALIDLLGGVDVVIFDNVMSLITGDQKDEIPWTDTQPLVMQLTRRRIGQIWMDHTGHNTDRQYGSSTKAWRFDAVGVMTTLPDDQRSKHELAFTLSFEHPGKARRRTPDNWQDFETVIIRLKDDQWTPEVPGNDNLNTGPSRRLPPLSDDAASLWQHVQEVAARSATVEQPEPGIPPVPTIKRSTLIARLIQAAWFTPENIRTKDGAISMPPQSELKRLNNRLDTLKRRHLLGFNRHCVWLAKREMQA